MKLKWIILVLVAAAGISAWWWLSRPRKTEVEYRTASVERGTIVASVTATGTIRPVTMVQVGSQVSGTIQALFADFNSRVKRNGVVAQLDPSFFQSQLAQSEASLARAEVNVSDAERTLRRSKELLERSLVSEVDVEQAQAALDRSRAELKQAKAAVDQARVNLEHTTITSPIDGVVVARNVDVGQTVAASLQAPVLFEIANDLTAMQVEASVDEADVGQITVGQPARFSVDAFPNQEFQGVVSQIRLQPITVQNVVTYTTVVAVGNPEMKLRPGMTANVSIEVARREDVLKVPSSALSFKPAEKRKEGRSAGLAQGEQRSGTREAEAAPSPQGGGRSGREATKPQWASREGALGDSEGRTGAKSTQQVWMRSGSGDPVQVSVVAGLSDGYFTEIIDGTLKEGDIVFTGLAGGSLSAQRPPQSSTSKNPFVPQRRGFF